MQDVDAQVDAPPASLIDDQRGTTTLEWALLLLVIAIPSYYILNLALQTLLAHYRLMTTLNALPFP